MQFDLSEDQVFNAYKKLKHYFFYDSTTLFVRKKIADFENELFLEADDISSVKRKLKFKVSDCLEKILSKSDYLYKNIDLNILPKKIKENKTDIVTNSSKEAFEIEIEKMNFYLDAPVEIHILSVLWVMFAGRYLDNNLRDFNYANKLNLDIDEDDKPQENLKLYKPYFVQYQQWRDDAIKKAEDLLNEKRNVTILSLDIKEYYHSIRLNLESMVDTLDSCIKGYYRYKGEYLLSEALDLSRKLTAALHEIHIVYYENLKKYRKDSDRKVDPANCSLPIGLVSSGLLANYYLADLDSHIIQKINPAFYGRYVDDLMFVFSDLDNHVKPNVVSPTVSFIYDNFVKKGIMDICPKNDLANSVFFKNPEDKNCEFIHAKNDINISNFDFKSYADIGLDREELISRLAHSIDFRIRVKEGFEKQHSQSREDNIGGNLLTIQNEKIVLHYFNWKESRAVLNIFKKRLEQQRSEFRFLPDEDEINDEFDEQAFSLRYNDSENKFRSIQDYSENKYGASKFLAKKIFALSYGDIEEDKTTDKQILTFFTEATALNFYSLWEKVATYFVLQGRTDHLINFKRNIEFAIKKIKIGENAASIVEEKLTTDLSKFLDVSISISLVLNPALKFGFLNESEKSWLIDIKKTVAVIRKSNLFRSSLISLPGINYTSYLFNDDSLLENDYNKFTRKSKHSNHENATYADFDYENNFYNGEEINTRLALLAPNYIPFHEVNILKIINTVSNLDEDSLNEKLAPKPYNLKTDTPSQNSVSKFDILDIDKINSIPDLAFIDYYKINYSWKTRYQSDEKRFYLKQKYFSIKMNEELKSGLRSFKVTIEGEHDEDFSNDRIDKRIAIANIKVDTDNINKSIEGFPNLKRARRKTVFKLLNEADRLDADMTVFPEVSTPYSWLRLLAERSHKRYMGIVAGLEHWVNNKGVALNLMVTILPFKVHEYKTSLIKIRLKNHYSHAEKHLLKGYRLLLPEELSKSYQMSYDLFHWRKSYFSVYNCFELADIYHRSLFKSKVDFIIASEYNQDTSYFSDIAGAWVRDVHTYFIQVNSSHFGDSRLIQPAKSYEKDLIQVKGGINSVILVGNLEIEKIRKFQLVEYHLQKDFIETGKYSFKPTPPDFNRANVRARINNSQFFPSDII
ncbi:RNA-directed DNA polymerase [Sphingobacterium deserti]|uniref:Reverse transcriptase domain-containing protein n=1 Tax=Sphingobacterium deserti TaxID=1229276 RepID=A0A0B8T0P7_9SPHI|nr:RNA-directed DNA polymerase [Sphingobacterium deserti]KGE14247.1 hypothetical protein DI53_2077 [Sphingobacterium deserti]